MHQVFILPILKQDYNVLGLDFPSSRIIIQTNQEAESEIMVDVDRDLFSYEADMVADHIENRQAPAMPWDDTLSNMQLLDEWRKEVGVTY